VPERVTVVSIVGTPRSGSTVLGRIVGELDGAVAVGELRAIWWSAARNPDRLCGCGERFLSCPFWTDVLDHLGVAPTPDVIAGLAATQSAAVRQRHPWRSTREVLAWEPGTVPAEAQPFVDLLERTYAAIAAVAGARVVVDSSKKSDFVALVSGLGAVDSVVVQTLRDPRGTLFSRYRRSTDDPSASRPLDALRSGASWALESVAAASVRRRRAGSQLVRYEDFAEDPEPVVRTIAGAAGLADASLPFAADDTAVVGTAHTVLGSPTRFETGRIAIRLDDAWQRDLHRVDRALVGALTAPVRSYVAGEARSRRG
jgi:hypothetical protein